MKKTLFLLMLLVAICAIVSCTPKHKHSPADEYITVKEATCGEEGKAELCCTTCKKVIETKFIPATGAHFYTDWAEVPAGGCSAVSYRMKACVVCGHAEYDTEDGTNLLHPHEFELIREEATCEKPGIEYRFECKNCGFVAAEKLTPALGHLFVDDVYTYVNKSVHSRLCHRCNSGVFESHSCSDWTVVKEATCYQTGLKTGTCYKCHGYAEETIYETHDYEFTEYIVEPTCTEDGEALYTCKNCQKTKTEVVPAKGHDYKFYMTKIEPNCYQKGLDLEMCANCSDIKEKETPKKHAFDDGVMTVESTCTQIGKKLYTCTICGVTKEYTLSVYHDTKSYIEVKATCTTDGNDRYWHCQVCGKYFSDAHRYSENLYYEERDYNPYHTIYNYKETTYDKIIHKATGHSYTDGFNKYDDENHWRECLNGCGEIIDIGPHILLKRFDVVTTPVDGGYKHTITYSVKCTECDYKRSRSESTGDPEDDYYEDKDVVHEHKDFVTIEGKPATCTEDGLTAGLVCGVEGCDYVYYAQVVIPALGHNFVNGICTRCGLRESQPASEGLEFALNSDGKSYSVTGIGTCTDTDLVIPSEYNGLPVTRVDGFAFMDCTSLTSVTIFDSVTSISTSAFSGCQSLTSVTLSNARLSIGLYAFSGCTLLTSINLSDGVTSIDRCAFQGCISLTNIKISQFVSNIAESAFKYCLSLESIEVDDNNPYYTSIDGNLYDKEKKTLIQYAIAKMDSIFVIPDSVEKIAADAFSGCSSLTNITIPDSVTSIADYAFYDCTSLTSITIPNSVTNIGDYAFKNCTLLVSVTIGNSVESICKYTFQNCNSLTSIVIPNSVTSIGDYAFYYCTSLVSVIIPNSMTEISMGTFAECTLLKSIEIPDSVTRIGDYAFRDCDSLQSITVPSSVIWIGYKAFDKCYVLTIYCAAESQPSEWSSSWNSSSRPVVWGYKGE